MKRIPIYVPEEHYEFLRKLSYDNRNSMAEEVRKSIDKYVKEKQDESLKK